jgi:hypothetical protein
VSIEYVGLMSLARPYDPDDEPSPYEGLDHVEAGWSLTSGGRSLRVRHDADLDLLVAWLRAFAATGHEVSGVVAAFDADTHELVVVTARDGRVKRRTVRAPSRAPARSNVIDLATHRVTVSRQIS